MQAIGQTPDILYKIAGIFGFLIYAINYLRICLAAKASPGTDFFLANILAATLVLISLSANFNIASALIQIFWIMVSLVAVRRRFKPASGDVQSPAAVRRTVSIR